ncbi:MAG TPA: radical SAM protein [Desulfomonilaceae bacterium]|nr:radical SAM protein [Desulfomonilaceae bacterium]
MKSALVLVPPNIPSMDSVAGGRFQATYNAGGSEASHWIPLWICYAAGAVPTARAMDCNVLAISREEFVRTIPHYHIYVFYANQETVAYDQETASQLHEAHKDSLIVFAGPYATVVPEKILASPAVDAVIRGELEEPLRDLCSNVAMSEIKGLTWKAGGSIISNPDGPRLEDLDSLPWVSGIIRRDLPLLRYRIPYLNYPYISLFSGRGCPSHCTYCLWPQTMTGHRYRTRNIFDVAEEMIWIHRALPQIREIQIEDDTFTCDKARVLQLCDALQGKGIVWSCCARHDLSADLLTRMKEAGARNLVVGFESGNDEILKRIKKGVNIAQAKRFMNDCRRVGLRVHGCFVFGLPGETKQTMQETLDYALELKPDTVQFTIASAYEGTAFNSYLRDQGFLREDTGVTDSGHLSAKYDYPDLRGDEINIFTHEAWKAFYLRPSTILRQVLGAAENLNDARRLWHGVKYVGQYLWMNDPHVK